MSEKKIFIQICLLSIVESVCVHWIGKQAMKVQNLSSDVMGKRNIFQVQILLVCSIDSEILILNNLFSSPAVFPELCLYIPGMNTMRKKINLEYIKFPYKLVQHSDWMFPPVLELLKRIAYWTLCKQVSWFCQHFGNKGKLLIYKSS